MKYNFPLSRCDAGRLWRQANRFYEAEKRYRDAQKQESKIKDYLFQAQQEMHLANLDRLSAGREMSDIIGVALQEYFDEPAD